MSATADRVRAWARDHAAGVPRPGGGHTWHRLSTLASVASDDLAFGRLAEGHLDALTILAEAGCAPAPGALYGVWASKSGGKDLDATRADDTWRLTGEKGFCSGAGSLDRALVTGDTDRGPGLFDVDLRSDAVTVLPGTWPAVGMADSDSETVRFEQARADRTVGANGFYTGRIGFWYGAVGVAACWYGAAAALVDSVGQALAAGSPGDTELAPYGAAAARAQGMRATLEWAAGRIDEERDVDAIRLVALLSREVVHAGCMEVLALAAAAGGARPICLDPAQSRRSADLYAYLAQYRPGRDTAGLGRQLLEGRAAPVSPATAVDQASA